MTFGTGGASPAVQLPALSNLDPASNAGTNEVYAIHSAEYDIVGFRLAVGEVYNGLVAAINSAVTDGVFTLPAGVSAEDWLKTPPSHVCLKVAVRRDDESWPPFDASPQVERRIAQKNLMIFDVDLPAPVMPSLFWKYFTMGGPLAELMRFLQPADREMGINTLVLKTDFPARAARIHLAVPRETYARWIRKGEVRGFKLIEQDCRDTLKVPFHDHVVLSHEGGEAAALRVPYLGDHALPMAIGLEITDPELKPGEHQVTVEHHAMVPRFGTGKASRCYTLEEHVVGGFTLLVRIHRAKDVGHR
jgi:hypothetical protein